MIQGEKLRMELEKIVIILEENVTTLIGRDPIGIALKNLLEPKFLKQELNIPIVDLCMEAGSWTALIQNPLEQLLMLKFVLVKSFQDVSVPFPSRNIIVDHSMSIIWMMHLRSIQDTVQFDTLTEKVVILWNRIFDVL